MFDSAIIHVLLDDNFLSLIITAWSDNAARIGVWSSARVNTRVNTRVNARVDAWVRIRDRARGCTRVYISFSARAGTRVNIKLDTSVCARAHTRVNVRINRCVACFSPAVVRLQFNGWETADGAEVFVWVVYKRHDVSVVVRSRVTEPRT